MPRLLILVPFCEEHLAAIQSVIGNSWELECHPHLADLSEEACYEALLRADAVIGEPDLAVLLRALDNGSPVRLLQMTWAGTDKYTRASLAFPSGVTLCNAAGGFGQIMSQYAVGQLLSLMQNLPAYRDQQHESLWNDLGPVASLDGARVLVFGAGNIGSWIARRLQAFDCEVVGVCRNAEHPREGFHRLIKLDQAECELPGADAIMCALPNTDETADWMSRERLSLCKRSAVLVNVGRGNFVDCLALNDALESGALRGAALDVTSPEPLPPDHPLWNQPRCVITPHVSGGSFGRHKQTEDNICAVCCETLSAWIAGQTPRNTVPLEAFAVAPRSCRTDD